MLRDRGLGLEMSSETVELYGNIRRRRWGARVRCLPCCGMGWSRQSSLLRDSASIRREKQTASRRIDGDSPLSDQVPSRA